MDEAQQTEIFGEALRWYSYKIRRDRALGPFKGLATGDAVVKVSLKKGKVLFEAVEVGEVTKLAKEKQALEQTIKEQKSTIAALEKTTREQAKEIESYTIDKKIAEIDADTDNVPSLKPTVDVGAKLKPSRVKK